MTRGVLIFRTNVLNTEIIPEGSGSITDKHEPFGSLNGFDTRQLDSAHEHICPPESTRDRP